MNTRKNITAAPDTSLNKKIKSYKSPILGFILN